MPGPRPPSPSSSDVDSPRAASLAEGARLHDAGSYWHAHEAWESRWRVETDAAERRFLQGLIQVTAAFHKLLVMGNGESAIRLLRRGLAKLEGFEGVHAGIDVDALRRDTEACVAAISTLATRGEPPSSFARSTIPRLALADPSAPGEPPGPSDGRVPGSVPRG